MNSIATKSLVNNQYSNNYPSYPYGGAKTLGGATGGGGSQDVAAGCAAWMEQNRYVYDAIMSGRSGLDQQQIQEFMSWWEYANATAFGSSWDPNMGGGAYPGGYPQDPNMGQQPVPAGATMGPNGNIVWDNVNVDLIHSDDPRIQDIWAENFSLDISSMSAEVVVEWTTDSRTNPPAKIKKVTVKNNASGVDTVYYVHGEANIIVRTANEGMFDDKTNSVTWEEYTGATEGDPSNLTDPKTMVDNLLSAAGRNEGQLLETLKGAGYPYQTIEELHEAIVNGDFPGELTGQNLRELVDFLNRFDPELNRLEREADSSSEALSEYRDYLISVLGFLYPNAIFNGSDKDGHIGFIEEASGQQVHLSAFNDNVVVFLEEESFDNLLGNNSDTTSDETPPADAPEDEPAPPPADEPFDPAAVTMFGYLGSVVGCDYNSPEFAQALKDIYGDDALSCYIGEDNVLSASEATRLVQDGVLPPSVPDENFLKLLGTYDEELAGLIQDLEDMPSIFADQIHHDIRDRLLELLDGIYGDAANVQKVFTDDDKIKVNGSEFNFVDLLDL